MKKRIVSLVLAFSIIGALCVPALAVESVSGYGYDTSLDTASGSFWTSYWRAEFNKVEKLMKFLGFLRDEGQFAGVSGTELPDLYWNWLYSTIGFGEVDEASARMGCRNLTVKFNSPACSNIASSLRKKDEFKNLYAGDAQIAIQNLSTVLGVELKNIVLRYDEDRAVYRPYESVLGKWVTDCNGRYFCYKPTSADGQLHLDDQWIQSSTLDHALNSGEASLHMTSKAALEALASQLGSGVRVQHWHEYYVIANMAAGNSRSVPIRCDYAGFPYACWYDENTAAVNTPRTTTEVENVDGADDLTQTNDSTEINYNGMTIVLPDGDFNIGEINYNSNNKTYNIEAYKYDITNNYYYTYNYSWTYHINYTSITYIGQSEEYDRTYNLYYQLPDGRSSADLTAEELEQLNLAVDVINYGRSADDTRLRSLYHFDGNTDDASYWNYCTAFTWNQGASLTYLESGNFNGALYLDETDHDFTLTLPSALGSNDFTLQFRYYQSATAAPQNDSYIRFGSTDLMRFNGSQILNGSGTVLSTMPIGTWNELAIIRESGTVRYYLNGVQLGTVSYSIAFSAAVTFHFGTSQQTYKELDELRVLNYALTSGGASYTPTSVPHDTNLALVLPDSVVPVADEYWDIHNDNQTNLLSEHNLDWWDNLHISSGLASSQLYVYSVGATSSDDYCDVDSNSIAACRYTCAVDLSGPIGSAYIYGPTSANIGSKFISGTSTGKIFPMSYEFDNYYSRQWTPFYAPEGSLVIPVYSEYYVRNVVSKYSDGNEFTLSIVNSNGTVESCTFNIDLSRTSNLSSYQYSNANYISCASSVLSGFKVTLYFVNANLISSSLNTSYRNDCRGYQLVISNYDSTAELIYLELVEGDHTDLSAEFVSSVTLMDSSSLNTPTLAVRSDIPVTNYQIGGVRPSIPYKGLVWAMVESGYISSLQIYDGRAWVQCDGRIWTGERWIPYSSYNVVTLSDMYDIADASGQSGYEYIYSESGFWSWFQKAWLDFRQWTSTMLSTVQGLGSGGGSSGGSVVNDLDVDPDSEEESSVWLVGFIKRIAKLGGRAVRGVSDIVIEDALSNAADGLGNMQSFYSADASEPDGYVTTFSLDGSDGNLHGFAVYDASEVWQ